MKRIIRSITTSTCKCICYDEKSKTTHEVVRILSEDATGYAKETILRMLNKAYPEMYIDADVTGTSTTTYAMPIETFIEHAQKLNRAKKEEA